MRKIKNGKSNNREDFIFWPEARRKYENPEVFPEIGKTWQLCNIVKIIDTFTNKINDIEQKFEI